MKHSCFNFLFLTGYLHYFETSTNLHIETNVQVWQSGGLYTVLHTWAWVQCVAMPLSGGASRLGLDTHKINHKYNPWTIFLFQVLAQYVYFEDSLNNCRQFSCQYSLLINFKLQTTSKFWRSIYTVVLIRVGYFVLLNYSYKSSSIIKTRDSFGICWS